MCGDYGHTARQKPTADRTVAPPAGPPRAGGPTWHKTLDAGWDIAAVGEGESTLLRLVDAVGDPAMPLPGTPWRDAPPGDVAPETISEVDRLSRRGALYGHWQRQRDQAARLAAAAEAYPRPRRSRTILPVIED